jgi:hypothetical protein
MIGPGRGGGGGGVDSGAPLIGVIVERFGALAKRKEEQERTIDRIRYQNLALASSALAYREHPTDLEEYKAAYRDKLSGYGVPLVERTTYEGILLNSEARFYSPMLLNRAGKNNEWEREQLLALADDLFEDGTIVLEAR